MSDNLSAINKKTVPFDLDKYKLTDLIDSRQLQHLFQLQYNFTGLPVGLLDNEGNILVGVGWQDICMEFHRKNPESEQLCRESDSTIKKKLGKEEYVGYKCKLGLWDYAIPVKVAGNHLGNLFFGQFFFDDDKEDTDYFIRQAKKYDFEKKEYLGALKKVPRFSKQKVEQIIEYYSGLADMITDQAHKNLLFRSEKENRELLKNIYNGSDMPMFLIAVEDNGELRFLSLNEAHEKLTGMNSSEVFGKTPEELPGIPPEAAKMVRANYERCIRKGKSIKYREMIPMFGKEMHWLTTLTPLYNNEGKIYRIVGTSMHINELVETQRELEHHRNNLEKLVEERNRKLSLSEKKYRDIFEDSPLGQTQTGIDGSLNFNNTLLKIFGYSNKELQEKNWKDLTHPDDLKRSEEMVQGLLEGKKESDHIEKRYLHKNGHYFWADVHTTLHRDDDGKPLFFIATISDITERKAMEKQVKESEEKYRSLFNNTLDGLVITNSERKITDCNETVIRMFGYSKEEIVGKPTSFFYALQDEYEAVGRAVNEHANDHSFFIRINIKTKSGKVFPGEVGVFYIKDSSGNVLNVIAVVRDITERLEAEKALEQSEEKHRAIFESATDAFIIADEKGKVVEANPSACRIYGYTYREIINKSAADLIHPDYHFIFPEMIQKLQEQGHYEGKTMDVRKDGTTFFTEIYGSTIQFNNKKHVLVVVRDVSEQKEANLKLEQEKQFTDAVIDAMPGVFYLFDKNGKFIKWNHAVENALGYSADQVKQISPIETIAPYHREKMAAAIQQTFTTGKFTTEADLVTKKGMTPYFFTGKRIFQNNKPLLLGIGIDITKRMDAEKAREKVVADLNERMKEMTCLYSINNLFRTRSGNLNEILHHAVDLIPLGWKYPERTSTEIKFDDKLVRSENYKKSDHFLLSKIKTEEGDRGHIKIFMDVVGLKDNQKHFISEEKALLEQISINLAQVIDMQEYEEALLKSEENLKSIIQHSPDPKLVITNDSKVELANEAFLKAMGYQSGEIPDFDSWWLRVVPNDKYREEITAQWKNAMKVAITENRVSDPIEVRLITRNKEERIFNVVCSSLTDKVIAVLTDHTDLIKAEKNFRNVYTYSPVSLWLEDWSAIIKMIENLKKKGITDFRTYFNDNHLFVDEALNKVVINDVNQETLTMFEADGKNDLVKSLKVVFATEDTMPGFIGELVALAEGKQVYETEMKLNTVKGNLKHTMLRMSFPPAENKDGQVLVSIMDITELNNIQQQLQVSIKDLKRSNAELEQFAYVSSHDLQEPLRMVSSYTQMLERKYKGKLDEKADKYIHYAVDGAVRMQTLINDLLEFSRVTTRGHEFKQTDLNDTIKSAVDGLNLKIQETQAKITWNDLPVITADKTQIERLFSNLLGNAIKFRNPDKNPVVHISVKSKGNNWLFSVKDNGIGIKQQFKDKIFIIFQRLHGKDEYPGTGIGLAICKQIVNRHGGDIWFEPNKKEGTTFYFTLKKDIF